MDSSKTTVAFIGLGVMGKAMARNVLRAGFPLAVHNRSQAAVTELAGAGARRAATPADAAAECEVVCLCVPDTPDVERVLFGADGVASRPGRCRVVIDFSTISAPATSAFASRLREAGIEMLDSPVSGGPKGAADATLTCMIGGDAAVLQRCMPILQAVGKTFHHIGGHGAGQLCKSCNQLAMFGTWMAVCEALTLARASGIDPAKVREALLGGSGSSYALQNHAKRYLDGQLAPGFRVNLLRKDIRLATSATREAETFAPVTALAEQMLNAMVNAGLGDLDSAALGKLYERLSQPPPQAGSPSPRG